MNIIPAVSTIYMVFQVLNKLKWTGELENAEVVILHRGAPNNEKTISGKNITELKKGYFCYISGNREIHIPHHRILRVIYNGKVIWKKAHK